MTKLSTGFVDHRYRDGRLVRGAVGVLTQARLGLDGDHRENGRAALGDIAKS